MMLGFLRPPGDHHCIKPIDVARRSHDSETALHLKSGRQVGHFGHGKKEQEGRPVKWTGVVDLPPETSLSLM